jgi:Xaa-Pro dipeptidase
MPRVRSALVYVPASGAAVLFANIGKRDVPAAKTITWVDDVRPFGKLPGEVIAFCKAEGLTKARVGISGFDASMPVADWSAIAAGLPDVVWQPRDGVLASLRASKQDWETAAIRRAARMADDALALAPQLIGPGVTVREVIAGVDRVARAAGAEDVRYMVASGPQAGIALRPVDDRRLAAGDTLLIYAALQSQRYWAETARTFVLGKAPAALRSLHGRAMRALDSLRVATRPGLAAGELAAAAGALLPPQLYGFGNAIGLDAEEYPLIASEDKGMLVDGTTLALRAIVHEGGLGVAAAQTIAVRGARPEGLNTVAPLVEIAR